MNKIGGHGRRMLLLLAAYMLVACATDQRMHRPGPGDDHFEAFLQYRGLPNDVDGAAAPTSGGANGDGLPHCTAAADLI